MSPFRYHDEESTAAGALYVALGALAGFAAGIVVAQHYGGLTGLTGRIRERMGRAQPGDTDTDEHETLDETNEEYDDHERPLDPTEELEERVLEAFRNDPILSERAIDIGALDEGIVELTGWVNAADEADQAVVITRGVPGVDTVVNRLAIRSEEDLFDEAADEYSEGDPALADGHWERQDAGRIYPHADDEVDSKAGQRKRAKKPPRAGRSDGSSIAPPPELPGQ